jgi:isoquinoline 1-oxidoreductase beta subunit
MNRRKFIFTTATVAGGIAIGGYYLTRPEDDSNPLSPNLDSGELAITPYLIIDDTGITIITPRAEMGQGIHGTLAALVAEELEISLADVKVIHGPPSDLYANNVAYPPESPRKRMLRRISKRTGIDILKERHPQLTGGQSSTQDAFVKMRKAGAAARAVLVMAAARKLGVKTEELHTANGKVFYKDGTSIPYTSLVEEANGIRPPEDPPLKPRDQWTQLGRSQPRVDMISKCTGTAKYSIDISLPGMLYATVIFNPHIGAGVKYFDDSKAKEVQGYVKAIAWQDGIIVIATNTWYAMQAAQKIDVQWEPAPYPATTADHRKALLSAFKKNDGKKLRDDGDVEKALTGTEIIEGTYHVPYLAHATMEPLNAVAWLREGKMDIYAGNQNPGKVQYIGSQMANISRKSVKVHTTYMGGGFGRRLENDFIKIAVKAAIAMQGIPVKVTWSREADMTHDVYRPMATAKFRGAVSKGKPIALALDLSSPSLFASSARRDGGINADIAERIDKFSTAGAKEQPYKIENYRVSAYTSQRLLPVGWWRGVGESQNVFFHESAIDELAHSAGADPLKMRISLLNHEPSYAVLKQVSELSNWDSKLPDGHARGVAYALSSGAATAQVIEISMKKDGIRIEKVFAAIDVGIALDPMNIEAQVQSSVIFGICAAMHGAITVTDSKVDQKNYNNYPIMRISQSPQIKVSIHESGSEIYGVGESGTPTAPPALGNAIFALTGKRIRELPFSKSIKFV